MARLLSIAWVLCLCGLCRNGMSSGQSPEELFRWSDDAIVLRGIKAVVVMVALNREESGLRHADLQTDVELRLRESGIVVVPAKPVGVAIVPPVLHLSMNVYPLGGLTGAHIVVTELSLREEVGLIRSKKGTALTVRDATTWRVPGSVALVEMSKLREVRDDAKDLVNKFVNAYLTANPKK